MIVVHFGSYKRVAKLTSIEGSYLNFMAIYTSSDHSTRMYSVPCAFDILPSYISGALRFT